MRTLIVTSLFLFAVAMPVRADDHQTATAELKDGKGQKVGDALLEQTPHGVLITLDLSRLPPGTHAFHIHETGKCEPPFKTAGGHFNPTGRKHGIKSEAGEHSGDLPNLTVGEDGRAKVQFVAADVTLRMGEKNSLFDADGSALVIHAGVDDHKTDPAGAAGDRIACGVVMANK
jgi:Cu-Zn family superoxide dismutase